VRAALSGALEDVPYRKDEALGISVPTTCPDIDDKLLHPRETWRDPKQYDQAAARLVASFRDNLKQFGGDVPEEVRAAGPG